MRLDYLAPVSTEAVPRRLAPRFAVSAAPWVAGASFLALLGFSLFVRTRAIDGPFWIDEGLTVGIASFPISEIPGVLRQDGSPPLYYLLLHVWIDVFGSSEASTHALSVVFALLAVPAALWAGWSLFGRRAGWIAAALAAVNPFLTVYAQETRMYSLVILLSILAAASFAHGFVFRRRRYVAVFALVLAVMLYTHGWALFFAAGALAAVAVTARTGREPRPVLRDAALAFGAAALAFAPWVPTLLYQTAHTGAPWSNPPSPIHLLGGFIVVLAGEGALVAMVLAAGAGLSGLVRGPARPERTAVLALLVLALGTVLSAWTVSQVTPAWATRYLGVLIGPVLLVAAAGLPRAGRLGAVALVIVLFPWALYTLDTQKSNADQLAARFETAVRPGDLILSTQPEQVPVLAYYFGHDKRYATPLGPVSETRVMDWRDVLGKLEAARPETTLEPLLEALPRGGRVLLVRPLVRSDDAWSAPWTELVRKRSEEWAFTLAVDERFKRTQEYVPPYTDRIQRTLVVELFEKATRG
jgi:mannosyltransferase